MNRHRGFLCKDEKTRHLAGLRWVAGGSGQAWDRLQQQERGPLVVIGSQTGQPSLALAVTRAGDHDNARQFIGRGLLRNLVQAGTHPANVLRSLPALPGLGFLCFGHSPGCRLSERAYGFR